MQSTCSFTICKKYNHDNLRSPSTGLHLINTQHDTNRVWIWDRIFDCVGGFAFTRTHFSYTDSYRSAPGQRIQTVVSGEEQERDKGLDLQKKSVWFPCLRADSRYHNSSEWLYTSLSTPRSLTASTGLWSHWADAVTQNIWTLLQTQLKTMWS